MTRDEFCKSHWEYFLTLEKDFLKIERFVAFDLGDNILYSDKLCADYGNSLCFSDEFVKQYQSVCSEIDVILKVICKEINSKSKADRMDDYTPEILNIWPNIIKQKVSVKDIELQPFINWSNTPYHSPEWWSSYNHVKHNRNSSYKEANLKNVLNSFAALYILEQYLVKYIGDRDNSYDVPNDISQIFEMVDYDTKEEVIQRNNYVMTKDDIDKIFKDF